MYDADIISDLPLTLIGDYIDYAVERELEKASWDMWLRLLPEMMQKGISFKEFKDSLVIQCNTSKGITNIKQSNKTKEEIIDEIEKVKKQYEKRR
ncbi:MAG TPA: hypothetical protein PKK91_07610 [bacterium]|nr:hypothetical protein [bacterium]HQL65469.1 hypothetical protein [bacterium]